MLTGVSASEVVEAHRSAFAHVGRRSLVVGRQLLACFFMDLMDLNGKNGGESRSWIPMMPSHR